jgi:ankyrin repeat protein
MNNYFLLFTALNLCSAPIFAQDSDQEGTPDSIGDVEQDPIPDQLEELNPLSKIDEMLMQSAYKGQLEATKAAVAKGANVNVQETKGRTPLILAASAGHTSVVEALLSSGADINLTDNDRQSALMYAAKASQDEVAAVLLENGAEVNVQSKKAGITALMLASVSNNIDLVEALLDQGADPSALDRLGRSAFFLADKKGNSEVAKLLENHEKASGPEH